MSKKLSVYLFIYLFQSVVLAEDRIKLPLSNVNNESLFEDIPSVYSASKYEQKVTKAPASISIVTADEIKKYGYRSFNQILSSLRGFYSTSDRAYGYVGARGFGLPSDYNSRLLLLIDGHRFNDNLLDSFDISGLFPVDVDVIERIEIVRGPSSSLYGTSAVFGVINIITKRGRDQHGANLKYSYGSNDSHKASISYGNRHENGLETFVTGTFYNSQGFNKLFYKEFQSINNGFSFHNDDEQSRKLMAKASYKDFSFQGVYINRKKDIPTASFGGIFNNPNQVFIDQTTFLEFKYDHTFENQLNFQTRLSYNNNRFRGNLPLALGHKGPSTAIINTNLFYGEWWRAEVEASKQLWRDHHLTLGGQYQGNFHQLLTNFDATTNLESNVNTYQWALFLQDDYSITDSLSLNAGVRYDYYSIFGSTVNPRVGLIYSPWQTTNFKLLYGKAFRAPNQFELNYKIENIQLNNTHLKPEKLETLEFIIEQYFNQQLRAEFNIFYTQLSDNIRLKQVGSQSQYQNSGNVQSFGVEGQIEHSWGEGFQGRISYSWQNTTDKSTGQRLSNSPEHMVKLNFIAPLWQDKVFLGFETQYMSGRKTLPGKADAKVGDYVISNLTLFTQNWIKGLELSAGAYNLFDERYFDPASADHVQSAIQQDGVTYRVKASLDF